MPVFGSNCARIYGFSRWYGSGFSISMCGVIAREGSSFSTRYRAKPQAGMDAWNTNLLRPPSVV